MAENEMIESTSVETIAAVDELCEANQTPAENSDSSTENDAGGSAEPDESCPVDMDTSMQNANLTPKQEKQNSEARAIFAQYLKRSYGENAFGHVVRTVYKKIVIGSLREVDVGHLFKSLGQKSDSFMRKLKEDHFKLIDTTEVTNIDPDIVASEAKNDKYNIGLDGRENREILVQEAKSIPGKTARENSYYLVPSDDEYYDIIDTFHQATGHEGVNKTHALIMKTYSILPQTVVRKFISMCRHCQMHKSHRLKISREKEKYVKQEEKKEREEKKRLEKEKRDSELERKRQEYREKMEESRRKKEEMLKNKEERQKKREESKMNKMSKEKDILTKKLEREQKKNEKLERDLEMEKRLKATEKVAKKKEMVQGMKNKKRERIAEAKGKSSAKNGSPKKKASAQKSTTKKKAAGTKAGTLIQYILLPGDVFVEEKANMAIIQACHARTAVLQLFKDDDSVVKYTANFDAMKTEILETETEDEMTDISEELKASNIDHILWMKSETNMATCIATKPYPKSKVNRHFKDLPTFEL